MTNHNGNGPTQKRKPSMTVTEQVAVGVQAVKFYAERARTEDTNNPVLSAMAVALLDAVERAKPEDVMALRLSLGYAMLGAFLYGQEAGAKIERSQIARSMCETCAGIADGNTDYAAAALDEGGRWCHKATDTELYRRFCEAEQVWEYAENERERNQATD